MHMRFASEQSSKHVKIATLRASCTALVFVLCLVALPAKAQSAWMKQERSWQGRLESSQAPLAGLEWCSMKPAS